jgi:hypothetical protein
MRRAIALMAAIAVAPAATVAVAVTTSDAVAASAYYVAPNGNDSAAGTQAAPWASIAHAQAVARPGDTVYFRGGTYAYTRANSSCASQTAKVDAITLNKASSGATRPANLVVNGSTVQTASFETTGAWTTWSTKVLTVSLNAGSNTIRLDPTTAAGLPNIDHLVVNG